MTYSVTWTVRAAELMARIVAAADDPARIRRASDYIDQTLRRTPLDMGESRTKGVRVWYGDVLGVLYHVDTITMAVRVVGVDLARRR